VRVIVGNEQYCNVVHWNMSDRHKNPQRVPLREKPLYASASHQSTAQAPEPHVNISELERLLTYVYGKSSPSRAH
jgi:hypothetical protein